MSSAINPVSECTRIELTPAEAFWQTGPGVPPYLYIPRTDPSSSPSSASGKGWKKKRTTSLDRMREIREAETYVMMCLKPECPMYRTFDKCEHNVMPSKSTEKTVKLFDITSEQRKEAHEQAIEILRGCKSFTDQPIVWSLCEKVALPEEQAPVFHP